MNDNNPLGSLFLESASRFGDRVAVKTTAREITYSQLHQLVINFALHLANRKVVRESLVTLHITGNPLLASVAILAITFLGGRWIKFDPALREQKSIRISHLLHNRPDIAYSPRRIQASEDWYKTPENYRSYSGFNFAGYQSADDIWFVAVSSGTTGSKKYMPISGQMFCERILRLTEYSVKDAPFLVTDLFTRASNLGALHFFHTLSLGGTYIFSDDYNYLAGLEVKLVVGSPSHLSKTLANVPPPEKPRILEVRVVGGALYPQFLAKLLKYFQRVRVSYGSTEAGPTTSRLVTHYTHDRAVGRCYPDIAVEIVDEENNTLESAVEGIVRIKTSSQITGYLDNIEASANGLRDGWFYPGDKGRLSANGDLYITGRLKDELNIAGLKINAAMIDEAIQNFDQIADVVCFVELNDQGQEALAALIATEPNADINTVVEKLIKFIAQRDDRARFPARFYHIEKIPRNENGKIMRHAAAELVKNLKPTTQEER